MTDIAARTKAPPLSATSPMYNLPEMRALYLAFWNALVTELGPEAGELPEAFSFDRPAVPAAIGPEIFFSQTCGYPLQTIYRGQYQLLGVPSYDAPGCSEASHCAFILVGDDSPFETVEDLRGTRFACNSRQSNSGMNLPRRLIAPLAGGKPFFSEIVETGTHPFSMARVAAGELDAASIDCMTYAYFSEHRPQAVAGLRVIAETPPSPAIPFVTSIATAPAQVEALRAALLALSAKPEHRMVLAALRIASIGPASHAPYERILDYEREAAELGYPELV
ncbi:phosphate/phosphite/phosphonate ABC transporter substrate-binding protein [Bosea sp. Root483D1]|uniref:phosphate/phosphite/phosphonate ABC transporter substrate-binding protein n=1 Tax=Bosea sp. Root483D1 TaxID=1736544 RepID=UPI000AFD6F2E|nr:PhnD/SsuA/transferrin family substrate-binding protein [Bosea sp. Root483D1]